MYEPWVAVKPVSPIRFIPVSSLDFLQQKTVELKEITSLLKVPHTSYESISVEDWGNTKKYTVVVQTPSGKEQNAFVVDKSTSKVEKVTTTEVVEKKVYTQTVVNKHG